jgi:hypothetical protein
MTTRDARLLKRNQLVYNQKTGEVGEVIFIRTDYLNDDVHIFVKVQASNLEWPNGYKEYWMFHEIEAV